MGHTCTLFSIACKEYCILILVVVLFLIVQVSAVEVYTPLELSVENGTQAKLPCTFTSSEVISSAASVTWSFQAEGSTTSVSVRGDVCLKQTVLSSNRFESVTIVDSVFC